ncbi:DUF554 domain-containing protein [Thermanaeromonas sp. C210]|uniref:DUF554 domain-containing protein n=1 Tax=Thermanaeromonas sp. C210 TaxID=2731925 RepID=UPI00155BF1B6|nr:DUF554 domain-containing protein [Thermanaeromonas sp. C210]GFN23100.1 membrane protein [Thermanaeromonas sp. C210]
MIASVINALAIFLGTMAGKVLGTRLPDRVLETVFQALGLGLLLTGANMALQGEKVLTIILGLIVGGALGELLNLEGWLERLGQRLEERTGSDDGQMGRGFVAGTMIFCTGAMAITGSLEAGLQHNYTTLYTKSLLDGTLALILTGRLGVGVGLSALSVLAYQGTLTAGAAWVSPYLRAEVVNEITATGGLLIVAIALNLLKVREFRIANLLPALLVVGVLAGL